MIEEENNKHLKLLTMDLNEFYSDGFYQEINRKILNPIGLCMMMEISPENSTEGTFRIKDIRKNHTGFFLNEVDLDKAEYIEDFRIKKLKGRIDNRTDKNGIQIKSIN